MSLLMIRPAFFGFNDQTAVNNAFQQDSGNPESVNLRAQQEFDAFVKELRKNNIEVLVIQDTEIPYTPDSIFPNNWISFHEDGKVVLYPMYAENRRMERKPHVINTILERFKTTEVLDFSFYETKGKFLEGTGSFVLDRGKKLAYACLSPRTDPVLFDTVCKTLGYEPIIFHAYDRFGKPIYHTNVMMCVADKYVVINLSSIPIGERTEISRKIILSGKEIIDITQDQMENFAGNMLQVTDRAGNKHLVMSTQAWLSLSENQRQTLHNFNPIIHSSLNTIEMNGGGSARCMMAEIYLTKK